MEWWRRRKEQRAEKAQQEEAALRAWIIERAQRVIQDPAHQRYGFIVECPPRFAELVLDIVRAHARIPYIVLREPVDYDSELDKISVCYIQQPRTSDAAEDPANR